VKKLEGQQEKGSPRRTHIGGLCRWLAVLVLLSAMGWLTYNESHLTSASATSGSGSFEVVGNRIIAPSGAQFVPYGVVVQCASIETSNVSSLCTGQDRSGNTGSAVIDAAATDWHASVVRLQLAQENLFSGPDGSVNPTYVQLVDSLVNDANSLGMVAIITLQEEHEHGYVAPTASSVAFWSYMADHYKGNDDVFFDLYNEPALPAEAFGSGGSESDIWNAWRNGATAFVVRMGAPTIIGPAVINYVGMQTLVNTIRTQGANNIIVAEGPDADKDLSELPTHYLTGSNIAYGVEPNLHGDFTQKQQYQRFGQYAQTVPIMPESFLDTYGTESCDANSPTDLPKLLTYLKTLHMGLIYWALDPGVGIRGTNLDDPTSYPSGVSNVGSSDCPYMGGRPAISVNNTIGPGALIQAYFRANSAPLFGSTAPKALDPGGTATGTPAPPVSNGDIPTPVVGIAALPDGSGYWLTDAQGDVSAHGDAIDYGSMAGQALNAPISHIVATPDGSGYWLVSADGGTFAFGDAGFYGSMGGQHLNAPVVDLAPTVDGRGYWLVASDGGIFAFGDAVFKGSMGGQHLNQPVVGIATDRATGGYWEVATDGGIFALGAPFLGSTGSIHLNQPVNGMTSTPSGDGYWFVSSDGGIFACGDAHFSGSMGAAPIEGPVVGMATDDATGGYWEVATDGGIFSFNAPFYGAS
jgi:hypothetical protein